MNALENIGLEKLYSELWQAMDKLNVKNEGRQESSRIFTEGHVKRAMEIVKALQGNYNDKTK